MQVAILAGGLGTRLSPLTESVAKSMVSVHGRPFLEYQLEWVQRCGFDCILLLVGYLAETIERYFQDGHRWGLSISYSYEVRPMGTAGALQIASGQLENQFLLLNGDTYLPINYADMARSFMDRSTTGLMTVYANPDGIAPNNVLVSPDGKVLRYDRNECGGLSHVDAGAYVFRKTILDHISPGVESSLENDVFPDLASKGELAAHPTEERYYDIGTFERLAVARQVLR